MGVVIQKKSRWSISNEQECTITIGNQSVSGYCADGTYIDPMSDDSHLKNQTHKIFYRTQTSVKAYAPSPPYTGSETIEDNINLIDVLLNNELMFS